MVRWMMPGVTRKPELAHAMVPLDADHLRTLCGCAWVTLEGVGYRGRQWVEVGPGESWCAGRCKRCERAVEATDAR